MSDNTVYLITGANRGIGLAVTNLLLTRPNTTVIATSRQPAPSLDPASFTADGAIPIHPTSRLIPVLLDDGGSGGGGAGLDPSVSSRTLAARLRDEHGIAALDVVVANAGGSTAMGGVLDTTPEEMERDFGVNSLGVVRLFQGIWPVLKESKGGAGTGAEGVGKFIFVSSSLGSIGNLDRESLPGVAYGMSKAAGNWFVKKVGVELKGQVVVGALHPGWVQTPLGQSLADAIGFKEPPTTVEQSAKGVVEQIDNWTPEKSGQFLSYTGNVMPW